MNRAEGALQPHIPSLFLSQPSALNLCFLFVLMNCEEAYCFCLSATPRHPLLIPNSSSLVLKNWVS